MSGFNYPKAMVRGILCEVIVRTSSLKAAIREMEGGADSAECRDEAGHIIKLKRPKDRWVKAFMAQCYTEFGVVCWWTKPEARKVCRNKFSIQIHGGHAWIEII